MFVYNPTCFGLTTVITCNTDIVGRFSRTLHSNPNTKLSKTGKDVNVIYTITGSKIGEIPAFYVLYFNIFYFNFGLKLIYLPVTSAASLTTCFPPYSFQRDKTYGQ